MRARSCPTRARYFDGLARPATAALQRSDAVGSSWCARIANVAGESSCPSTTTAMPTSSGPPGTGARQRVPPLLPILNLDDVPESDGVEAGCDLASRDPREEGGSGRLLSGEFPDD